MAEDLSEILRSHVNYDQCRRLVRTPCISPQIGGLDFGPSLEHLRDNSSGLCEIKDFNFWPFAHQQAFEQPRPFTSTLPVVPNDFDRMWSNNAQGDTILANWGLGYFSQAVSRRRCEPLPTEGCEMPSAQSWNSSMDWSAQTRESELAIETPSLGCPGSSRMLPRSGVDDHYTRLSESYWHVDRTSETNDRNDRQTQENDSDGQQEYYGPDLEQRWQEVSRHVNRESSMPLDNYDQQQYERILETDVGILVGPKLTKPEHAARSVPPLGSENVLGLDLYHDDDAE